MSDVDFAAVAERTAHRPYPRPNGPWVMTMSWHDLLFAHFTVRPDTLRATVPAVLPLDLFEGRAYVGVVPFHMSRVSPRGVPEVPFLSAFPELNVRTYVTLGGKPGVYFFSLDTTSSPAVWGARTFFHLPYFKAEMSCVPEGEEVRYRSKRVDERGTPGVFEARYGPAGPVAYSRPGTLEHFLTERYCLYSVDGDGRAHRGEIHHDPWPLQPAHAEIELNTVAPPTLTLDGPPLLHFARRLDVVGWPPEKL